MLKIKNQDDCYLYNNVSNYKYGLLSSQSVPALFWIGTLLLSNCHYVTILQFCFFVINSMNLADLSDKAAKTRQKETKEAEVAHWIEKTNRRKKKRQVLCESAQQAPVHYYLTQNHQLGHRTTSWSSDGRAAFLLFLFPPLDLPVPQWGTWKSRLSLQLPSGASLGRVAVW